MKSGFPGNTLDDVFVQEPSGRVLGFQEDLGRNAFVYGLDRSTNDFTVLTTVGDAMNPHTVSAPPAWLTLFGGTAIPFKSVGQSRKHGIDLLQGDRITALDLDGLDKIDGISNLFDLKSLGMAAIATYGGHVYIVDERKAVAKIEGIDLPSDNKSPDVVSSISSESGSNYLVVSTSHREAFYVPISVRDGLHVAGRAHRIDFVATYENRDGLVWQDFPELGGYFAYGYLLGGLFSSHKSALYRLEGGVPAKVSATDLFALNGGLKYLESRNEILIWNTSEARLYGKSGVHAVTGWGDLGAGTKFVFDLGSIGKTVVTGALDGPKGLYELTSDNALRNVPMPPDVSDKIVWNIIDLPDSHAAILFTDHNVLALDKDGRVTHIRSEENVDRSDLVLSFTNAAYIPGRREVFFGEHNHFVIRDQSLPGARPCKAQ